MSEPQPDAIETIQEKILGVTPRRGRGPGWIKLESRDVSSFDAAILQLAAASVGATVACTYQHTRSKKDPAKHYCNVVTMTVITSAIEPVLATSPQAQLPSPLPKGPTPYLLFDQADDAAIVERIKGHAIEAYVYRFTEKESGQDIYGLGVDGAEACKRELARNGELIEEESVVLLKDDAQAAYFEAHTSRWALHPNTGLRVKLDTALGFKRQSKTTVTGKLNPFWFEQGTSKALRNAILRLTPEEIKQRVIDAYKERAKTVSPVSPVPSLPPAPPAPISFTSYPDRAHLIAEITKLSDAMQLPTGMKEHLWGRYVGKGLTSDEADPVALAELLNRLLYRSKNGEWPE